MLADETGDFDELEAVRIRLSQQEQVPAQALSGDCQSCPEIAQAVTSIYRDILGPGLSVILSGCNNAVEGVAQALDEYEKGNEQMALDRLYLTRSGEGPVPALILSPADTTPGALPAPVTGSLSAPATLDANT